MPLFSNYFLNEDKTNTAISLLVDDLQNYINKNNLSSYDSDAISDWKLNNQNLEFEIYFNDPLYSNPDTINPYSAENSNINFSIERIYPLKFSNKIGNIAVIYYYDTRLDFWANILGIIIPIIFLLIIFMGLLGKKIRYINEIQKGIEIIEGGSMDYSIPIRGNDELASLSKSINEMSRALDSEIRSEEKAKKANHQLITSVSHDIRTPLTSIICYLELIQDERIQDPITKKKHLHTALEKAYQIKALINNLFIHSLADNDELPFVFTTYNGPTIMNQFIEEMTFALNEKGFKLILENCISIDFSLELDLKQFRRIFDNLISNILKYADPNEPIDFGLILNKKELCIIQRNKIKSTSNSSQIEPIESHGIGLETCKRIMQRHYGRINHYRLHKLFKIELTLPIYEPRDLKTNSKNNA